MSSKARWRVIPYEPNDVIIDGGNQGKIVADRYSASVKS
jgi:hypothetical protein